MKKIMLIVTAITLTVAVSAFTAAGHEKSKKLEPRWWKLIQGSATVPENYEPWESQPCFGETSVICGVYTIEDPDNLGYPDMDEVSNHAFQP